MQFGKCEIAITRHRLCIVPFKVNPNIVESFGVSPHKATHKQSPEAQMPCEEFVGVEYLKRVVHECYV